MGGIGFGLQLGFQVLGLDRSGPEGPGGGHKQAESGKAQGQGTGKQGSGQGVLPIETPIIYHTGCIFPGMSGHPAAGTWLAAFWVFAGGGLGSVARFWMQGRLQAMLPGPFPLGTLAVNLAGSFCIGGMAALFETLPLSAATAQARLFLFIGVLGGYTTFSSFSLENLALLRSGQWRAALLYVLASNVLGILLASGGYAGIRALLRQP